MLRVLISDTGCGILTKDQSKITKMFSRIFSGNQVGPGVGLGLNICKHITRQFEGDIIINSEPGQGSKIEFTFKVQNALFKDDSLDEEDIGKQERLAKIQMEKEQKKVMEKNNKEMAEMSRIENIRMGEISSLGSEKTERKGGKMTLNDQYTKMTR
jgi:hypothetical protein